MDDTLLVDIDHGLDDLADVYSGLKLCQSFSSFGQVFEGVVAAIFEEDVDVLLVLEGIDELDDVFMFEGFMDFYLDK